MSKIKNIEPRVAIQNAAEFLESGQLELAESTCRSVLLRVPNEHNAIHLLGMILSARGKTEEAIATLERVVKMAPQYIGAWLNLGIVAMDSSPERAEACFRKVLAAAPDATPARGNLAMILERRGQLEEAEKELRELLRFEKDELGALQSLARILRLRKDYPAEVKVLHRILKQTPGDAAISSTLARTYFLWYDSVDQDREQALKVIDEWLVYAPTDPTALHMRASLTGEQIPERASSAYVEKHFDEFAGTFDSILTSLAYNGPELVHNLLGSLFPAESPNHDVVDVGCGTGRFGPLVRSRAKRLVGLDLSQNMMAEAKKLGVYDELVHTEVTKYLEEHGANFDIAACIDTVIYFGSIDTLFAATCAALRPSGHFFATIELLEEGAPEPSFRLHKGGRYAHKKSYVARVLEKSGFSIVATSTSVLRMEYGSPVEALVFAAKRSV
ncbi:MAG: tetratricopeptide repeat protein [Polyangiaceae bacterium]|nr:tetratricopeptide repeat protein [Polyangiaceae bacterium]